MSVAQLALSFQALKQAPDPDDLIFSFKAELLASDAPDYLEFHYRIIQDPALDADTRDTLKDFFSAEAANRRDPQKVGDFLHGKLAAGIDTPGLKADLIQMLGHLRSAHARPAALAHVESDASELRYRSIIVLGWVGTAQDLSVLSDRLHRDVDPKLRGDAATAMRQLWFRLPRTRDKVLAQLRSAIASETDSLAIQGIVIVAQDMLKKKLGLKESRYGDVSGDVQAARLAAITALDKLAS